MCNHKNGYQPPPILLTSSTNACVGCGTAESGAHSSLDGNVVAKQVVSIQACLPFHFSKTSHFGIKQNYHFQSIKTNDSRYLF